MNHAKATAVTPSTSLATIAGTAVSGDCCQAGGWCYGRCFGVVHDKGKETRI